MSEDLHERESRDVTGSPGVRQGSGPATLRDDMPCQDCGQPVGLVWYAPNNLFNHVTGTIGVGYFCPSCFEERAASAGIRLVWRADEPGADVDLDQTVEERNRWVRLFNRLDVALSRHRIAKSGTGFCDDNDDALYAAHDRVLKAASDKAQAEPSGEAPKQERVP